MLMRDRQRMLDQMEVELRERAPTAADHVEIAAARRIREACRVDRFCDLLRESRFAAGFERGEAEHAERQRDASANLTVAQIDQLEAAAAEIADNAVRLGDGRDHPEASHAAFLLAGEQLRLEADVADSPEEELAIGRVAHRGGRDHADPDHAHLPGQEPEALECAQGPRLRLFGERTAGVRAAAEPGHDLLVEDDRRDPSRPRIDHEANRVGPDIDDRDWCPGDHRAALP
jgi:hypothetical protein